MEVGWRGQQSFVSASVDDVCQPHVNPMADEFLVHEIRSPSFPFVHSLAAAVRRSARIFRFGESRNGE